MNCALKCLVDNNRQNCGFRNLEIWLFFFYIRTGPFQWEIYFKRSSPEQGVATSLVYVCYFCDLTQHCVDQRK